MQPSGRSTRARDVYRPLLRAALLVAVVFLIGVIGYRVIGGAKHGWIDAIYMTAITLTTVGYREVIDVGSSPAAAMFTTALLLFGVGSFLYFFSSVTAFLVEGAIGRVLWSRRMTKAIDKLSGHVIVCGGGNTGQHILRELRDTGRAFVLIEHDLERVAELQELLGTPVPAVVGDATSDDVLLAAGIERAEGLVACISSDKDNLIVTVSARLLRKELRIVCRCIEEKVEEKIRKAGADTVVSPNRIGGLRMVSELVRPTAVSFLDVMLRGEHNMRVEARDIAEGSPLWGRTIAELRARDIDNFVIVAVRDKRGGWVYNPADALRLEVGMSLVFIGSPKAREELGAQA